MSACTPNDIAIAFSKKKNHNFPVCLSPYVFHSYNRKEITKGQEKRRKKSASLLLTDYYICIYIHLSDILKGDKCKVSHHQNKRQAEHKHVCKLTAAGSLASAEFCSCQLQQAHRSRGCSKQIVIWAPRELGKGCQR